MDIVKLFIKKQFFPIIVSTIFIIFLFIIQEIRTKYKIKNINKNIKENQYLKIIEYKDNKKYLEQKENDIMKRKYIYRKLHDLYYKGVCDKYNILGNKINGIKPDPIKAINYLILAYKYGDNEALLKLAKIHHNGMYNFEPNLEKAEKYYKDFINSSSDKDNLLNAKEGLEKLIKDRKEILVYNWLNIERVKKNINNNINNIFTNTFTYKEKNVPSINSNSILYKNRSRNNMMYMNDNNVTIIARDTTNNYNDAHNTHNSQVLSTIKNSLNKLKKSTKIIKNIPNSLKEIRFYINSLPRSDKREDALNSLDSIEKSTSPLTFCNMKEVEALNLVWNRIHNDKHNSNRKDLKETLFNELAEMQEHGKTVCSTGKFTRIVDTLNVVDDEVTIKPTYAINQEMMNKSANIRKEMLSNYSECEQKKLEMGTSNIQEKFEEELKNKIRGELKKDYVESNILTEEKFNNEINKWIGHI